MPRFPDKRTPKRWLRLSLIVVAAWLVVRDSVADCNRIVSVSLTPTLLPGDRVLVNRLSYGVRLPFQSGWLLEWGSPRRGDVIVLASPLDGKRLVKRVVGLPGDRLEVRDGRLWINGQSDRAVPGPMLHPTVVPPRHYFVLGDNGEQSADSRCFGCVSRDRIAGRVLVVVVSLDPAHRQTPRWHRFACTVR
jgi:signal peptidase I